MWNFIFILFILYFLYLLQYLFNILCCAKVVVTVLFLGLKVDIWYDQF